MIDCESREPSASCPAAKRLTPFDDGQSGLCRTAGDCPAGFPESDYSRHRMNVRVGPPRWIRMDRLEHVHSKNFLHPVPRTPYSSRIFRRDVGIAVAVIDRNFYRELIERPGRLINDELGVIQ